MLMRCIRWNDGRVVSMDETGGVIKELTGQWSEISDKVARQIRDYVSLNHGDAASGLIHKVSSKEFFSEQV